MSSNVTFKDELIGALPWVLLSILALGGAIAYFVLTGDGNTLPWDYGHNV